MGKSPGKWIKNVLFGKKSSKSNFALGKKKPANEKEVHVRVIAPETGVDYHHQEVPSGGLGAIHVDEQNSNSEYKETSVTQQDQEIPARDHNADVELIMESDALTDAERIVQEKAATKTQAAYRGYLARRAFKALKGIIRLQALIRGHLVRRQAVATLYCVVGIVKLQALVRGSRIRCSDAGIEVQRVCIVKPQDVTTRFHGDVVSSSPARFSANAFIRKLLAPSPQGMPLRVQYDETDSNSVQIWLERWTVSCPWKPVSPPKKSTNSKIQKKPGNSQAVEGEIVRPKRSVRKVPSLFDNESEKPRRNPKKVSSHTGDTVQENPQNEFEKVKRSLRKVHNPVNESSAPAEVTERPPQSQEKTMTSSVQEVPNPDEVKPVEKVKRSLRKVHNPVNESSAPAEVTERPPQSQEKTIISTVQEVPNLDEVKPIENMKEETTVILKEEMVITVPKENGQKTSEDPIETSQSIEISNEEIIKVKSESFEGNEKDENTPVPNGELKTTVESMPSDQKSSRRASLSAKQEHIEDGLQNTMKLPSYMQATQSAKAKLRGQGSPRLGQDSAEKNNVMRRHSLPSPANGKVGPASPRTPKILQGSGKGGNKSDKSLLSSRDGNALSGKTTQEWRR